MTISRPKVAHVTTAHPVHDNRILRKECAALAQAGFDVHLVAVADKDDEWAEVSIDALPRHATRLGRMFKGPVDAWNKLRELQPSMIHVHDPELIPMAILWKLRHRRPAIFDAHEDLPKQVLGKPYIPRPLRRPIGFLARLLERAADRHLDAIVAATPSIERNFSNSSVVLVQNFPLLQDYSNPEPTPVEAVAVFSYVGGIAHARGGQEMVDSVTTSKVLLRISLAGPATEEMQGILVNDTSGRINYLGVLPADRVPEVIANSSAGLVLFHPLPNHLECQPTKLFEYMAAGRPFIASNFKFWRELLEPYDCGYFVDPMDVGSIQGAMERIVAQPIEAMEMGRRGRNALLEHFTFENESRRLVALTTTLAPR